MSADRRVAPRSAADQAMEPRSGELQAPPSLGRGPGGSFPLLERGWRLLVTGFAFVFTATGALVFTLLVFPVQRVAARDPARRRALAQETVRRGFAVLVGLLRFTGVMRLETVALDALRERLAAGRGGLVLANHPTFLDIVVLLSLLPRAICVVKRALWANPFYGGIVRATGYVSNADPSALIADCALAVAQGQVLVIFPEGTRSTPGAPLRFRRGAAHVALQCDCEIHPVLLSCTPVTLTKGSRWYEIPDQSFCLRVEARPSLSVGALVTGRGEASLAAREMTHRLEQYFTGELQRHGCT
ncbi:MAG: 1-acyl-sn-glycerol-3-phosphate acyltransferase [Betaproteobacteria bacterium]|nr:1-acyl-sn-glycerol-3-phosphate acyltransferase [Betaproteobacteria bacterium]